MTEHLSEKPVKGRMMYLMHVPWKWIKQRPQFLAEGLSKEFQIDVFQPDPEFKSAYPPNLKIVPYPAVSKGENMYAGSINYYIKLIFFFIVIGRYRYIWLSNPNQFNYIKRGLRKSQILIYDCMDDALEFYSDEIKNMKLRQLENKIVDRANVIFVSAESLQSTLLSRYRENNRSKIHIINNGIKELEEIDQQALLPDIERHFQTEVGHKVICYIGTISMWMDFQAVLFCLEQHIEIKFLFVGPLECTLPVHERLIHIEPVEHNYVFSIMQECDALIMPFALSKLVLGVNPVKAYEYIYSGKPVILRSYPETVKFSEFAYLYETKEQMEQLIADLKEDRLPPMASKDSCIEFARNNTWKSRINRIISVFNNSEQN